MFDLGIQELIVIFIVALIVFGPKRLPELGRTLGKGMAELRRAMDNMRTQVHTEFDMNQKIADPYTPPAVPQTENHAPKDSPAPPPDTAERKDEKVNDR